MNTNPSRKSFIILSFTLSLFALTVAGCAARHIDQVSVLEPAPTSQYAAGTTFVYSNGTWEKVISATREMVTWENHRGTISTGSPDFTHRRFEWQTLDRRGTRQISPRNDIAYRPPTSLWPLQKGKKASFREDGQWRDAEGIEKTYSSIWSCEVTGTERVSVMAGVFDTWKITCRRYSVNRYGSASRINEVKTWHYAPEIGHPVLITSRYSYDRPSRRRELMAVLPPENMLSPAANDRMNFSLQKSLESNRRGKAVRWEVPGQGLSGKTIPMDTYRLANNVFCRRYVQEVQRVEEKQNFYGMACRNSEGKWIVPRK